MPVTAAPVQEKDVPLYMTAIGTAESFKTVQIHAQLTGQLSAVNFKEGEDVTAGQVLFELDRRPLEAALRQAEAALQRDTAQAANATAVAKRLEDLQARGIAPRDQLDTARSSAAALQATVEADRAAIENATVQLSYATIKAPISGRTGALMVHQGNLVRANDATPLVVINQVSPIFESFSIPEARLPDLRHYMAKGQMRVQAQPSGEETSATGRISFVDNQVDATTGTIRVKAEFPNTDHLLWPGQYSDITITLTVEPKKLVIPTTAVQTGQQGSYVFIIGPDQKVQLKTIKVDRTVGNEAIIAQGISAGDTVVTDGQLRLNPGVQVSVKSSPQVTQ